MIRPFKDIDEFKKKTGLKIGDIITLRVKQDTFPSEFYTHEGMITGFSHKVINIGSKTYPLEPLSKFEYLKDNKWVPFTVEVADTPAKFQAGKKYFYYDDDDYENKIFINAKYVDPKDKAVTVVFEDVAVRIVKLDPDGNEYIGCTDSKDGYIKAINEVKRED